MFSLFIWQIKLWKPIFDPHETKHALLDLDEIKSKNYYNKS